MRSRVYETAERPSVCLSICPIIRRPHVAAAGLLLSARLIDCCLAWRRSTRTPRKLAGWRAGVNPLVQENVHMITDLQTKRM